MKTKETEKTFTTRLEEVFNGCREALSSPECEVEPGEIILGTLQNPKARALYSMAHDMKMVISAQFKENKPETLKETRELITRFAQLRERIDILDKIFWQFVYEEFSQTKHPKVTTGIRKGWQVVIFKSSSNDSVLEFLMGS